MFDPENPPVVLVPTGGSPDPSKRSPFVEQVARDLVASTGVVGRKKGTQRRNFPVYLVY